MTAVEDKMHELFTRAALADDDLGYPDDVTFLPGDQEWADNTTWEILHDERKAVVIVTDEHEIMLVPRRNSTLLRWIDGLRGSTPVLVQWHAHDQDHEPYAVATHVGRHPLDHMRKLAHAA